MAELSVRSIVGPNNLTSVVKSQLHLPTERWAVNFPFSLTRQGIGSLWQAVKQALRQSTKPDNHSLVWNAALDMTRSKSELVLENALLRQQLSVLQRQIQRPELSWRDRTLIVLLASKLHSWKQALVIIQPDTALRCHLYRDNKARYWRDGLITFAEDCWG